MSFVCMYWNLVSAYHYTHTIVKNERQNKLYVLFWVRDILFRVINSEPEFSFPINPVSGWLEILNTSYSGEIWEQVMQHRKFRNFIGRTMVVMVFASIMHNGRILLPLYTQCTFTLQSYYRKISLHDFLLFSLDILFINDNAQLHVSTELSDILGRYCEYEMACVPPWPKKSLREMFLAQLFWKKLSSP